MQKHSYHARHFLKARDLNFKKFGGYTLVEILVVSAIVGLVATTIYRPLHVFLRGIGQSTLGSRAMDELRPADVFLEQEFLEMVELRVARPERIEFIVDSNRSPSFDASEDHLRDPDDDGDAGVWLAPSEWWRRGNDLDDDDDDGDGKLDVWMAYSFVGDTLVKEVSFNEGPIQRQTITKYISSGAFSYFGSLKRSNGVAMDTNLDGFVTAEEIDAVLPPGGVGDASGTLNTAKELREVVYIQIQMTVDLNKDGVKERSLQKNITPPLLNFRTPRQ